MTRTQSTPTFWKTAFIYGGLAGFIIISAMLIGYSISGFGKGAGSMAVGFLLMIMAMSLIFFGIRRFRDQAQGGVIRFSKAFGLGLAMSLFSAVMYIGVWEIYLAVTGSDFIVQYTDHLVAVKEEGGMAGAELEAFKTKMKNMVESYGNPFYRIPVTFTEIFPLGLIITLISSLALHNPKFWAKA